MFCSNCGKEIDDKAVVCIGCGVSVKKQVSSNHTQHGQSALHLILPLLSIFFAVLAISLPITQLAVHFINSSSSPYAYLGVYSEGIVITWIFSGLSFVLSIIAIALSIVQKQSDKFKAFLSSAISLPAIVFSIFFTVTF